jgi:hypothetical protein
MGSFALVLAGGLHSVALQERMRGIYTVHAGAVYYPGEQHVMYLQILDASSMSEHSSDISINVLHDVLQAIYSVFGIASPAQCQIKRVQQLGSGCVGRSLRCLKCN